MAFIVNHGGVVHSVPDEQLDLHLGTASIPPSREVPAGKPARLATADEIDGWYRMQGLTNPERAEAESAGSDQSADQSAASAKRGK